MYNLIEMQNKLKSLSKEQLMQVLKSGSVPQYMVVSELNRRKNMESDQARREATDGANTVTQEVINAVGVPQGGIAQLAGAMNAQTDNTQNTGVMQMAEGGVVKMQEAGSGLAAILKYLKSLDSDEDETSLYDPENAIGLYDPEKHDPPSMSDFSSLKEMMDYSKKIAAERYKGLRDVYMAEGGVVKMKTAGSVRTDKEYIAELKRLYPEVYELYKDNYNEKDLADMARAYLEGSVSTPDETGLEALEAPRRFDLLKRLTTDPSRRKVDKARKAIKDSIEERELQARQETLQRLRDRDRFYIGADPIHSDGGFSEQLKGTVVPVPLSSSLRDKIQTSIPNNMSGPSVATDRPLNMANVSQPELGPMFPLVSSNRPIAEPTNLPVNTSPAFTSMLPNMSQKDAEFGGDAKDAAIKRYLATGPRDSYRPEVRPFSKQLDPFGGYGTFINNEQNRPFRPSPVDMLDAFNQGEIYKDDPRTPEVRDAVLDVLNREDGTFPTGRNLTDRAMLDVDKRAIDFIKSDTYQPPSEIYPFLLGGDPRAIAKFQGESPEEVQAISDRLAREAAAGEVAKEQGFYTEQDNAAQSVFDEAIAKQQAMLDTDADAAMLETLKTTKEAESGLNAVPFPFTDKSLGEVIVDSGEYAVKGVGNLLETAKELPITEAVTQVGGDIKDLISEGIQADKIVRGKISDYLFGEDVPKEGEGSLTAAESTASKANEAVETKTEIDPTQAALNKIIENQQKQAEASNMSLSKYLEGLEEDREFAKAMALVDVGAKLMEPSPTFGEGVGKALQKGNKSLREGLNSYNKNKLAVLALDSRIKAAKASASARAGIAGAQLQTAALSAERDALLDDLNLLKLQLDPDKPDPKQVDRLRELQRKVTDLNNQIRTASGLATLASVGADSGNIFGSYDVTKTG